jgi:hypothetical protein
MKLKPMLFSLLLLFLFFCYRVLVLEVHYQVVGYQTGHLQPSVRKPKPIGVRTHKMSVKP